MASVEDTIIDTAGTPEVVKHPPDRGKQTPAPGKKPKLQLPPSPTGTETVGAADLYVYTHQLEQRHWDRINGYLYQLVPVIRRKPSHLTKISGPIDAEWILSKYGSGRYQVKLNDADGAGTIIKSIIELQDPERPNKFNIHELDLKASDNRQLIEELKREGKLTQDGDVVAVKAPENADATMAEVVKTIALRAMEGRQPGKQDSEEEQKLSSVLVNWALKQTAGDKAENSPGKLAELMKAMKDLMPVAPAPAAVANPLDILVKAKELFGAPAKPAEDPMMKLLMDQLSQAQKDASAERQRNHELQLKMLENKAEAADPMEMVEKVLHIQEKLGGGERTRRAGWPGLLEDNAERIFDLGEKVLGAIAYKRATPPAAQPRPNQQQQQPAQPPQQTPPATPAATGVESMPPPPQDPDIAMLLPILELQGKRLVEAFKADPLCGADCAIAIASPLLAGKAGYERMARMGREKILATIELIPQMKADLLAIGTQEMINDFIDDIIAGPEDPDEDDEDDDDPDEDGPEPGFADPIEDKQRPKHKKKVTV